MRLKSMMMLVLASSCGLVAMFLFQQATAGNGSASEQTASILVVKAPVAQGERLTEENVEFREYPVSVIPESVITNPDEFKDRAARVKMFTGDFVTVDKLTEKGDRPASQDIPSGMVAITINVDAAMTGSGLLLPGDRVDIYVTFSMRAQYGTGKVIKTVLEYVEVFATDQKREIETTASETKAKTITLLVTPQQAAMVKLADDIGDLHLAMRSKNDAVERASDKERFKPEEIADFFRPRQDDEESESNGEGAPAEPPQSVREFIKANSQPVAPAAPPVVEPPVPVPPAPPATWAMQIYSGDKMRVEEVPLSGPEPQAGAAAGPQDSGNPLLNGFKRMFGGTSGSGTPADPVPPPVSVTN